MKLLYYLFFLLLLFNLFSLGINNDLLFDNLLSGEDVIYGSSFLEEYMGSEESKDYMGSESKDYMSSESKDYMKEDSNTTPPKVFNATESTILEKQDNFHPNFTGNHTVKGTLPPELDMKILDKLPLSQRGCYLNITACPAYPALIGTRPDPLLVSHLSKALCGERAFYYHKLCQLPDSIPLYSLFLPTGTYTRFPPLPSQYPIHDKVLGYDYYPNSNVIGEEMLSLPDQTILYYKFVCDRLPLCKGFTDYGSLKKKIDETKLARAAGTGVYVKHNLHLSFRDRIYKAEQSIERDVNTAQAAMNQATTEREKANGLIDKSKIEKEKSYAAFKISQNDAKDTTKQHTKTSSDLLILNTIRQSLQNYAHMEKQKITKQYQWARQSRQRAADHHAKLITSLRDEIKEGMDSILKEASDARSKYSSDKSEHAKRLFNFNTDFDQNEQELLATSLQRQQDGANRILSILHSSADKLFEKLSELNLHAKDHLKREEDLTTKTLSNLGSWSMEENQGLVESIKKRKDHLDRIIYEMKYQLQYLREQHELHSSIMDALSRQLKNILTLSDSRSVIRRSILSDIMSRLSDLDNRTTLKHATFKAELQKIMTQFAKQSVSHLYLITQQKDNYNKWEGNTKRLVCTKQHPCSTSHSK